MQMLEPPNQQGQQHKQEEQRQQRQQSALLNNLHPEVTRISADLVVFLLSIVSVTIVFAASLGFDFVIILTLKWLFGSAFGAGSIAGIIFSSIQYISYLGAGISYFLMIFLLLGLYTINSLSPSWRAVKKNSKSLKSRVDQLWQDTRRVLIDILWLFLVFIALIFAIASALALISWALSPILLFLEAVKIFTAVAIVTAYVVNIAPPLWHYGKDIFHKLFEKSDEQEESKV